MPLFMSCLEGYRLLKTPSCLLLIPDRAPETPILDRSELDPRSSTGPTATFSTGWFSRKLPITSVSEKPGSYATLASRPVVAYERIVVYSEE